MKFLGPDINAVEAVTALHYVIGIIDRRNPLGASSVIEELYKAIEERHIHVPADDRIFVFGSNLRGVHGAGAALYACDKLGAVWGRGEGLMGKCYALPTCSRPGERLPLSMIELYIKNFVAFATDHPEHSFFVSEVGCGLAGYTAEEIAPLFASAPNNCDLPKGWRK